MKPGDRGILVNWKDSAGYSLIPLYLLCSFIEVVRSLAFRHDVQDLDDQARLIVMADKHFLRVWHLSEIAEYKVHKSECQPVDLGLREKDRLFHRY